MKIKIASRIRFRSSLFAAVLWTGVTVSSYAAPPLPPSPVFTNGVPAWDCLITGANGERGIMFIDFTSVPDGYGNYTFNMVQIHTKIPTSTPVVPLVTTNSDGRGGSDIGRNGSTTTTTNNSIVVSSTGGTNIYGYLATSGSWGYNYQGKVFGFYAEYVIDTVSGTNITYFTNEVSFIGKVTPNKRFTAMYSSTLGGNGTFSGVPMRILTNHVNGADFSGPWTGKEINGPVTTVELLTLTASGFPNAYDVTGDGPSYTLDWGSWTGKCLFSCQKKFAIAVDKYTNPSDASAYTQRATIGALTNCKKVTGGVTRGLAAGTNVTYNAYFVPFVPYP